MLKIDYINPAYQPALQQAGVLNDGAILAWNHGRCISKRGRGDLFRANLDSIGPVYIKRYIPQKERFLRTFRTSQALLEYRNSAAMATLGIPQAEPVLAAAVSNRLGMTACGIYIMREVENAVSLDNILEQMQDAPDHTLLKAIVQELITLVDRMHRGNFCHWDLKPRNLLVTQQSDGPVLIPIDSRSGRRMNILTRRACIARDYRFLICEPLLRAFLIEAASIRCENG